MTTLPQTTSIRLPRRSGGPQLPAPASGGGGMMPPPQQPNQMTGADVWRVIRGNLWLIILSVIVFGVGGYFLNGYLHDHFPRYTATGLLQVQPNLSHNPLESGPRHTDRHNIALEQRTHAQVIRHDALLSHVLTNSEPVRGTLWFQSFNSAQKAMEDLKNRLRVSPIPDSTLVLVEMSTRERTEARVIVQEIGNEHVRRQRDIHRNRHSDRNARLTNMRDQWERIRANTQSQMHQIAASLSMDHLGMPGRISGVETNLQELVKSQLYFKMNVDTAENALAGAMQRIDEGIDPPRVEEIIKRDPHVHQFRSHVHELDVAILEAKMRYGPDYPMVGRLQASRDVRQAKLDELKDAARVTARAMILEEMGAQLSAARAGLAAVEEDIDRVKRELALLSNDMANYLSLRDEERASTEMLRIIQEELQTVTQIQTSPDLAGVSWATPPHDPDLPSFPRLPVTLALAVVLGLAFSLGIAFLRELLDTSVRSPRDIARIGQMNLLGMIPHGADDPQAGGAKLPLVIFEAPHSMTAEQFRQARTRLQHAGSLDTMRSILVTSPSPGDGKTTVACNLAAGLALNGRRILLVDANFRRPELHRVFAIPNDRGFADTLNSVEQFDTLVHETQVPNLSVLASGKRPANATELLESRLLIDFIERALEEYDHVVFDSGPFLFISDSVAMAPRVDGVVTVVRARTSSRGLLQRMRDALRQTRAEHVGVVLNAVRAQGGGYYGRNIKTYYAYQNGHE